MTRSPRPAAPGSRTEPGADATVLDLFRRIKSVEQPDGSWPGAEVVPLLCAWFVAHGIDPDQPLSTLAERLDQQG